jgi:hypothetical protein
MKVIYNRHFPFGNYHAINLFGIIFVQKRWGVMGRHELNHEFIHTMQQLEMTYPLFYLWYGVEYLVRLFQHRFNSNKAYHSISFEREAYANEHNLAYPRQRRPFAWFKHLRQANADKT